MSTETNEKYKWLAVILAPCLIFAILFFVVDNPAAHSGIPLVSYVGENASSLQFDFLSPPYHARYKGAVDIQLSSRPDFNRSEEYIYISPRPYLNRWSHQVFSISKDAIYRHSSTRSGNSLVVLTEKAELEKGITYYVKMSGCHKGLVFNRPAKDVYFSFILDKQIPDGAVDLGLSVFWGEWNLGSGRNPYNAGDTYQWGVTEARYGEFEKYSYKWWSPSSEEYIKYNTVDQKYILDPADDPVVPFLGGKWRTPTKEEWQELFDKCTWEWNQVVGSKGFKVTSKSTGNSIFLPAAYEHDWYNGGPAIEYGAYWTANLYPNYQDSARAIVLWNQQDSLQTRHDIYGRERWLGLYIRPVSD